MCDEETQRQITKQQDKDDIKIMTQKSGDFGIKGWNCKIKKCSATRQNLANVSLSKFETIVDNH